MSISKVLKSVVAAGVLLGVAGQSLGQSTPLSWRDPYVVRVGERRGLSEARLVIGSQTAWMRGISMRVRNDNLTDLHVGFSVPGRYRVEWMAVGDVAGSWRSELSYTVPIGYAIVGFAARCRNDNASRMCVFYRAFDGDRLSGPVLYRVLEHRSGQCVSVESGFDRPTGYEWEVYTVEKNRLLIGVGMRVNSDDFKHLDATYAVPM